MPIQVKTLGNWEDKENKYRWDKPSINLLTNPVGVQKIIQKWSKLPQQFNAWMLKGPGVSKYNEIGQVDEAFLTNNLKLKIVPNPTKPDEINIDPNAINVIYTQNIGSEKVPMNYWTIAHRFGHTVRRNNKVWNYFTRELEKDIVTVMDNVFGRTPSNNTYGFDAAGKTLLKKFANALGTMGSTRKNQLRNFDEFAFELLAQYMITGKVTFNRLPFKMIDRYAWGNPQHIYPRKQNKNWNDYIEYMEEKYQNILEEIVEYAVGKIFIM